jgi:hypothetical protein
MLDVLCAGETPGMTPGFSLPSNMQWTPAREGGSADYSSLDKDAADLGAQLDFFGRTLCCLACHQQTVALPSVLKQLQAGCHWSQ